MGYTTDNPSQTLLTLPSKPETTPICSQKTRGGTKLLEIDDEDIKYRGTPLNVLHENNWKCWMIENSVSINRDVRRRSLRRQNNTGKSIIYLLPQPYINTAHKA
jgi:hypothetical protein